MITLEVHFGGGGAGGAFAPHLGDWPPPLGVATNHNTYTLSRIYFRGGEGVLSPPPLGNWLSL